MKKMLYLLFLVICITVSCRLTDSGWNNFNPPGDSQFTHQATAEPVYTTLSTILYDNYAFTADGAGYITIYNVINSLDPYLINHFQLPASNPVRKIEVDWRINLYVASGDGGLYILDCSNPSSPFMITEEPNIQANDLSYFEDYLAVIVGTGFRLYYLSGNSTLFEVNSFDFFDGRRPMKILLKDNWLYVFSENNFDIFDVTNLYNISHEYGFYFHNRFVDFTILTDFIVLITTSDLFYIDIFNPLHAEVVKSYALAAMPSSISARNEFLFIGWENRNLSAYKILSIDVEPLEDARIYMPYVVRDIDFKNDMIYLSIGQGGLAIYYYWM